MDDVSTDDFHARVETPKHPPSHIIALDHVAIAVRDLDEAIDWYTSTLGFRLAEKRVTRGEATGMISAVMCAGASVVVLVQGLEANSQVQKFIDEFGPGVQHIAFQVDNLGAALVEVQGAGGAAETTVLEGDGIRQAFLRRDPGSAVRVELIERNGGTFSDASVEGLFREMERRGIF